MSTLDIFNYADQQVRTVVVDGEPWFVAADVAAVLGYSATAAMTRSMDDDEKGVHVLHTPGGDQSVVIVSEPGLYEAILRSRVPQAQEFKRWVKRDVLPTIRKTGAYAPSPAELSREDILVMALDAERERIVAVKRAEAAEAQVAITAPKAEAFDAFLSTDGDYSINEAAKVLSRDHSILTGERRLRAWLIEQGWIYRDRASKPRAYQNRVNAGHLAEKAQWHYHPSSGEKVVDTPQVRVTAKGLDRLRRDLGGPLAVVS